MKNLFTLPIVFLALITVAPKAQASNMSNEDFQQLVCAYLEYEEDREATVNGLILPQIESIISSQQENILDDIVESEAVVNEFCFSDDD